jgi:hypothetical protein
MLEAGWSAGSASEANYRYGGFSPDRPGPGHRLDESASLSTLGESEAVELTSQCRLVESISHASDEEA